MQRWTRAWALRGLAAATMLGRPAGETDAAAAVPNAGRDTPQSSLARLTDRGQRTLRARRSRELQQKLSSPRGSPGRAVAVRGRLGLLGFTGPPEVIFDQRLGDLFVVRLAGNVADDLALGSIEYAVEHFQPALVLILGHEKCGAVSATLETLAAGSQPAGFTASIITKIMPAARRARRDAGNALHDAVRENVVDVVAHVRAQSARTAAAERRGALRIAGATYSLGDGRVTFV